tara:strand:- start:3740 stop:4618 length:879 start_codon:yes stop_codon:yes gene_type:complete
MNMTMEKFIKFPLLKNTASAGAVTDGDGSATLKLIDSSETFTQFVFVNDIVWDTTTNSASGGELYIVTAIDSDTQLSVVAIGPTAAQGTGLPAAATYRIYSPQYTKIASGTADGTTANQLVDTTVNFAALGVKVGDTVDDVTGGSSATVTGFATNTNPNDSLTLSADIFVGGDVYKIYREGPNDYDKLVRASNVSLIENLASNNLNNDVDIQYAGASGSALDMNIKYAYSDTSTNNEDMRNAIQDAVVAALQTPWPNVVYDWPGLQNTCSTDPCTTNTTWLGGKEYFFIDIR